MFDRNYYYLVAGLKEFFPDSDTKCFDATAIIEEIKEGLTKRDRRTVELFYAYYDIENIINLRKGRSRFSDLGNFSRTELKDELENPRRLPKYIADVLAIYDRKDDEELPDDEDLDLSLPVERALFKAYYDASAKSSSAFLRRWTEFDRTLRNISAALAARRKGITPKDAIVGDGEIETALARSSAADFGLKGEVDYIDRVIAALGDDVDIIGKEKRIDDIRWEMADELTATDYFNIDFLLGYLTKVNIIYRWASLDPETGSEMLTRLVDSLTGSEILGTLTEFEK